MALRRRAVRTLGRPVPSCAIRIVVGFGKGRPLPGSPLRRAINPQQATAAVAAAANRYFAGYTVTPTAGVFLGEGEPGLALDIFRTQYDRGGCAPLAAKAQCLAADLRNVLRQHSVLVITSDPSRRHAPLTADLVTRSAKASCPIAVSRQARRDALVAARGV